MQKYKKIDQYQLMEIIGKGANGLVYKGLNMIDGSLVAVKQLLMGKSQIKAIKTQLDLLKKLEHPLIVKFIDAIQKQNKIYLILEYMQGGSLAALVRKSPLQEEVAKIYVKQILNGLVFLHKKQVIHRDIKGANILLTKNGLTKLADFGVAVKLQDNQKTISAAGSPYWMAPQIISSSGEQPSSKCDIWSLGCTVIELLTGNPPYYDLMQFPALFRIVEDKHPPIPQCSIHCKQFLLACFIKNPKQRPSAQQLLNYAWLKSTSQIPSNLMQQQQKIKQQINQALRPNINYSLLQKIANNIKNSMLICNHSYFQAIIQDNRYPNISRLNLFMKLIQKDKNTLPILYKTGVISRQFLKMKQKFQLNQEIYTTFSNFIVLIAQVNKKIINQIQIHGSIHISQQIITIFQLVFLHNCIPSIPKILKALKKQGKIHKIKNILHSLNSFISTLTTLKNQSQIQQIKIQIINQFEQNDGLKQILQLNFYSNSQQQTQLSIVKLQLIQMLVNCFKIMFEMKTNFCKYIKLLIMQILKNGFKDSNQTILITKFICLKSLCQFQYSKIEMERNGFIYYLSQYYMKISQNLQSLQLAILFQSLSTTLKIFRNQKQGIDKNRIIQFHRHKGSQNFKIIYNFLYSSKIKNIQQCALSQKMHQLLKIIQYYKNI